MEKYKIVKYGQWWYGILNTETNIILRVGPNPNYDGPLDDKENKLLLFKSKDKAQEYINTNLLEEKLIQSSSDKALQQNIKTEIDSGKSPKQAAAIAYNIQRKNENMNLKEELSLSELVKDSINHLVNDLGKDSDAEDFADDVINDIENNYNVDVDFSDPLKYKNWASEVACEVSRQLNEALHSEKEIYYTLHQTDIDGNTYSKENYITKDDVRSALNTLLDTYTNYGSENVRGLLVTEGDKDDQIALYWSSDGMDWEKDFDFLNSEVDTNDDFGGTDMLDLEEAYTAPEDYTIATLGDIVGNLIDNVEDSQIDREIKFFKSVANKLNVKDYDKLYVIVDDGDYNPEFIFQDGLTLPDKDGRKVIHFPKANMIAEYNDNGLIYLYFTTEDDAKLYLDTAYNYLNPIDLDENKEEFAENKIDASEIDSSIRLKRIDDEFKW